MPHPDDSLHLEIGHVLFIDIVGYSQLLIEEQKERLNQLTEIVLATAPVREVTDEPFPPNQLHRLIRLRRIPNWLSLAALLLADVGVLIARVSE